MLGEKPIGDVSDHRRIARQILAPQRIFPTGDDAEIFARPGPSLLERDNANAVQGGPACAGGAATGESKLEHERLGALAHAHAEAGDAAVPDHVPRPWPRLELGDAPLRQMTC